MISESRLVSPAKLRKTLIGFGMLSACLIAGLTTHAHTTHHSDILWLSHTKGSKTEQNIKTLYPERIALGSPGMSLADSEYDAAILYDGDNRPGLVAELEAFAQRGGIAVLDLSLYADLRRLQATESIGNDEPSIIIMAEHPVTHGLVAGDELPWYREEDGAYIQTVVSGAEAEYVLAESSRGGALLILEPHGQGYILATDLSGLREPSWRNRGEFNKYLFLGNALGQTVHFGRHYAKRYPYAEFIGMMAELAETYPNVQMRDEGDAYGHDRIYSLVLGDTEKPAFLAYAAVHGGEWEPAYGLLRLAEILAQYPDANLFNFNQYHLVLVPIFNPSGYDAFQRNSVAGVDLNRPFGRAAKEPEFDTYKAMLERINPLAILDFHNNAGGDGYNRLFILPRTFADRDQAFKNEYIARKAAAYLNEAIKDRYVVHESRRSGVEQFNIESIWNQDAEPRTMIDYAAQQGIPGFLVELAGMYPDTYGLVFITDLTIETFFAFVRAYSESIGATDISQEIPLYQISKETLHYPQEQSIGYSSMHQFRHARIWGRGGNPAFLLHAEQGKEVNLTVQQTGVIARQEGEPLAFVITGPDGGIIFNQEVPFSEETNIAFTAPSTGIYTVTTTPPARGVVVVPKSNRPVNLHLGNEKILFRNGEGDYFFWVPAGIRTFTIRLSGTRSSAFSSKLLDQDGNLYGESGDAGIYEYWVQLDEPSQGGIWTLQMRQPQMGHGGGFHIEMRGVPPLLSASPEHLLLEPVRNN